MANSTAVVAGNDIKASDLNDLREDVLDASSGHQHLGGTEEGKKILGRSIDVETIQTSSSETIAALSSWVPGVGVYNFVDVDGSCMFEIYVSGAWKSSVLAFNGGMAWCDGTNMRFTNASAIGTATIWYQKF
jgi:hypothetical protein